MLMLQTLIEVYAMTAAFRKQLLEGQFSAGIPVELAVVQQFGVARVTVRRALEPLAAEGLISRKPRRGTRVLSAGGDRVCLGTDSWPKLKSPASITRPASDEPHIPA